jgi:hypothetical protein
MNPRRTPQGIGNNHPFNPPANLDGCNGPDLADGQDVSIAAPRICETVLAASG